MLEASGPRLPNIRLSNSRSLVMLIKNFSLLLKLLFLAMALALFSSACGSSEPDDNEVSIPLPGGSSINLDKSGGEVNIEGEDGGFHMKADAGGVEYPAELEEEFPVCPGCTPVQVMRISGSISAVLKVDGSMEDAHKFYMDKARDAGYQEAMNNQMQNMKMYMAEKGEKTFSCNTAKEDDGSVFVHLRIM